MDSQARFTTALSHWANPIQPPVQKDDADKRGGFKDPWGTTWWVGTRQPSRQGLSSLLDC